MNDTFRDKGNFSCFPILKSGAERGPQALGAYKEYIIRVIWPNLIFHIHIHWREMKKYTFYLHFIFMLSFRTPFCWFLNPSSFTDIFFLFYITNTNLIQILNMDVAGTTCQKFFFYFRIWKFNHSLSCEILVN